MQCDYYLNGAVAMALKMLSTCKTCKTCSTFDLTHNFEMGKKEEEEEKKSTGNLTLNPEPMPLLSHRDHLISAFRIACDAFVTHTHTNIHEMERTSERDRGKISEITFISHCELFNQHRPING